MTTHQRYTITALDEFGRLYHNTYVFGYFEDLKYEGVAINILARLVFPILKKMGEDASAEWTCTPEHWTSLENGGWEYTIGERCPDTDS